jgi:hypothetical protein
MRKPSAATIMAAIALFVSLGGVGVAASGTDFILGRNNTAKAKTSLTAPVAGNSLQITNTLPAGSALGLSVDPASPPFTTNSSAKVPNLNSDLLDGQNSTAFLGVNGTASNANKLGGLTASQFMQGGGSISAISGASTAAPNNVTIAPLGDLTGFSFSSYCQNIPSGQSGAAIALINNSGKGIQFLRDGGSGVTAKLVQPGDQDLMPLQAANHFIWHGRLGNHGITIETWTYFNNGACTFDVQMITGP